MSGMISCTPEEEEHLAALLGGGQNMSAAASFVCSKVNEHGLAEDDISLGDQQLMSPVLVGIGAVIIHTYI
eukprot:8224236-Pyramimonas_sp.AAC.1